ncbi:hypothetical protein F4560_004513 [Saccharothrix ecbatanensis]|uniref:Uncharacterized protein n=1 Tax=Saccharothrix ecbatanensis TaxID=1105145 RepID=A0A7W9M284_9PSEU|nr:hypothetical protein [Saccharothrix ecbatanensis]MBB5804745.1 hypothetical protein [Saccharothrix ecbatanensis]
MNAAFAFASPDSKRLATSSSRLPSTASTLVFVSSKIALSSPVILIRSC